MLAGYLNLALVYLKLNKHLEGIKNATSALEMDPQNTKALFRRGLCFHAIQEYEKALKDFNQILEMDKDNKAVLKQVVISKNGLKVQREKEKRLYQTMMEAFKYKGGNKSNQEPKDVWKELADEDKREFRAEDVESQIDQAQA